MSFRYEAADLSSKIPDPIATSQKPLFNAGLAGKDHKNLDQPVLADALPQLRTDTWRVDADGQMETTYRLKPNLSWHDGQPLTADDFVFAGQVYSDSGLTVFGRAPQEQIRELLAPDPRTLVIRWTSLYADADILSDNFAPLPRHILGDSFASYRQDPNARDVLLNHPFWTSAYVGLGPYRLERWEPGVALYGQAFPGYVFGKPKIDHVVLRIFGDETSVLTNVLAGQVQFTTGTSIRFEQGMVLKREWEAAGRGAVILNAMGAVYAIFQFRPDYLKTPALMDVRVRRALNYSIDRQALQDGIYEGQGRIIDTVIAPDDPIFPDLDRVLAKYDFDPRKTEALMNEAGFARDASGFYASASGTRFRPDFQVLAGRDFERQQAIMADTWAKAGIDTVQAVLAPEQSREPINRNIFPGISQSLTNLAFNVEQIGSAENKWAGSNREGWNNPEYEGLWAAWKTTLERPERNRLQVQMYKLISEQLPGIPCYSLFTVIAQASGLRGPVPTNPWWSVQNWEMG
jgi:peptide/nickel transport system substrate-binding protein